jgi:hypothetical protein
LGLVSLLVVFLVLRDRQSERSRHNQPNNIGTKQPIDKPVWLCKRLGPAQVLASKDQVWVFFEISWYWIHSKGAWGQRGSPILRDQFILGCDDKGWRPVVKVKNVVDPTFHTNITSIVRLNERFYAWTVENSSEPRRVFRWNGKRFTELPVPETHKIQETLGVTPAQTWESYMNRVKVRSKKSGWELLYCDMPYDWYYQNSDLKNPAEIEEVFNWRGKKYAFMLKREGRHILTPAIAEFSKTGMAVLDICSFDDRDFVISEAEVDAKVKKANE